MSYKTLTPYTMERDLKQGDTIQFLYGINRAEVAKADRLREVWDALPYKDLYQGLPIEELINTPIIQRPKPGVIRVKMLITVIGSLNFFIGFFDFDEETMKCVHTRKSFSKEVNEQIRKEL